MPALASTRQHRFTAAADLRAMLEDLTGLVAPLVVAVRRVS